MKPNQPPDLLALLHDVARLIRLEADKRARLQNMTRAQWVMLLKLAHYPGLSQKDLAEILEVEPMTVARLTDRLEARGLVERRADPRDRRIWRLHLRAEAEPILCRIETQRAELATMIIGNLPSAVIGTMFEGLSTMKAALIAHASDPIKHTADAEQELV